MGIQAKINPQRIKKPAEIHFTRIKYLVAFLYTLVLKKAAEANKMVKKIPRTS
ncbi:hypothetical protein FACS1894166_01130 [Bacilli bacterium]|nr:hypothetical protein FACS1894166_01130 [Bacilli bacterium]